MNIVQKPTWHYGGTFDAAWNGTAKMGDRTQEENPDLSRDCALTLNALRDAHVVTLDIEQYLALPTSYDVLTDFTPDPHLPFPVIYVSVGDPLLAGVLIGAATQGEVAIIPFWGYSTSMRNDIAADNAQRMKEAPRIERVLPIGLLNATTHDWSDWIERILSPEPGEHTVTLCVQDVLDDALAAVRAPGETIKDSAVVATVSLERALSVVRFLESANVDFEDTPVSRQVRRQAGRKEQPIAQRVYVRSPRHRRRDDGGTEHEHIEFRHRFEVRGHYKHYGEDTRLFRATERDRPHKIIQHPKLGRVVRIWCPDFVKGPDDRPLVVKTRVYKKREEAA